MTTSEHPPDGYDYQTCGLCNGVGGGALGPSEPCPPCKATGKVLVHQPPIQCPRCHGDGRARRLGDGLGTDIRLCIVCRGSGWAMTKFN
jgi:DnaJ-class molecular chaperone